VTKRWGDESLEKFIPPLIQLVSRSNNKEPRLGIDAIDHDGRHCLERAGNESYLRRGRWIRAASARM